MTASQTAVRIFKAKRPFIRYLLRGGIHSERKCYEFTLAQSFQGEGRGRLTGVCAACEKVQELIVDQVSCTWGEQGDWIPNWRERLECPACRLNTRQRAMVEGLKHSLESRPAGHRASLRLYATEQVTPFFDWVWANTAMECIGSEFLGPETLNGSFVPMGGRDIRHEDVQALSFEDEAFDYLFSNDVLEHVDQPKTAIAEMVRVMRPRAELFLSVPFHAKEEISVRRARLLADGVEHLAEPQYHGNPVSSDGSLVFFDFGWDLLSWLKEAGLARVQMRLVWSKSRGYLGEPLFYFHAVKPLAWKERIRTGRLLG